MQSPFTLALVHLLLGLRPGPSRTSCRRPVPVPLDGAETEGGFRNREAPLHGIACRRPSSTKGPIHAAWAKTGPPSCISAPAASNPRSAGTTILCKPVTTHFPCGSGPRHSSYQIPEREATRVASHGRFSRILSAFLTIGSTGTVFRGKRPIRRSVMSAPEDLFPERISPPAEREPPGLQGISPSSRWFF